ncbi:RNA-directed DNA polymerase, eukaryota, reverse transcriptase zinc-binding domain protein [Tanacetum coccineum]
MAEVELFILFDLLLSDDVKSRWTDEMLEFYMARISEMEQHGNENCKRVKTGKITEDEVREDLSTHAEFMTQDNVFSHVDASMAYAVDNDNAGDEIKLLIAENDLSMCAVIETSLNKKLVNKAGDFNAIFLLMIIPRVLLIFIKELENLEAVLDSLLDRVMGNSEFLDLFEACHATFLPYVTSDHCPALLVLPNATVRRKRYFRFMNYLADKSEFHKVVEENWNEPVTGCSMFVLAKRLKGMKKHLRELNKRNGNVYDNVKSLRAELKKVQSDLDKDPYNARLKEDEMILNSAYKNAVLDEENVLKQKTKVEWLREGDHNSAYFHNLLKGRFNKSRIVSVEDNMGKTWYEEEVAQAFVDHFQSFLGTCDEIFPVEDPDILFQKKMDADIALHMVRVVSDDEVKAALFDINDQKAPALDGFTSRFFKASWGVVGKDVCSAVKEFFTSGKMLGELNTTLISLIPKCKNPVKVCQIGAAMGRVTLDSSKLAWVSCWEVVGKTLGRMVGSVFTQGKEGGGTRYTSLRALMPKFRCRLAFSLDGMIQSKCWGEGRRSRDTTQEWLAMSGCLELMFGYLSKMKGPRCAFKVDIQKAYDTVSWEFLKFCLISFGFHRTMVDWIMVFTSMLKRQIKSENKFKYHWGCKNLEIVNLCFADDLMLFCHGDLVSAFVLRRAFDEFCLSSGLRPNMAKSTVYFGNVRDDVKSKIMMAMPFNEGSFPIRYLGIPLDANRICRDDCTVLKDSIDFLCPVSMNVFWASMFVLPQGVCDDIDKLLKEFLWKTEGKKGIRHSVAWKEGGLGLRSTHVWNEALMAKHLWNVVVNKESIWVKWVKSHYLIDNSVWAVDLSHHASWVWKQILALRDKIRSFVKFKIGDGRKCFFWFDSWYEKGPLCKLINYNVLMQDRYILKTKVSDLIIDGIWRWPQDWNIRFKEILGISAPNLIQNQDDKVIWVNKKGKEKNFSVKEGRLKTQDRISRWLNIQDMRCPFCYQHKDSHSHLFFGCDTSRRLWERLKGMAKLEHVSNSWAQIISSIVNMPANNTIWSVIQKLVLGASVYYIWQERNIRLFGEAKRSDDEIFKIVFESVRLRLMGLKLKATPDVIKAAEVLWRIIYLVFILFMDCTRGNDDDIWEDHDPLSICLVNSAYGDVPVLKFTTEATISKISAAKGWYYSKCITSDKKVPEGSLDPRCSDHDPQPRPNYGLEAHSFVPDCNEVVNAAEIKDIRHLPDALKQFENTGYIFQYHFGKGAKPRHPDFKLDVAFKPSPEPLLVAYPSPKDTGEASQAHSKATKKTARRELFQETKATEKNPRQKPEDTYLC